MKRFAWLIMFLALGLFSYTGCGGPPGAETETSSEDDDLAESDMAGMGGGGGDGAMGAPEDEGDDAGGEDADGDDADGDDAGEAEAPADQ